MGNREIPKLGDLTSKIGSGATPRGGSNEYKEDGISLIRSQNVLDFQFSYSGLAFIDEKQANALKNVIVEENDVLLNITGDSVARCCIVPGNVLPARVNQHVLIIRLDPEKADYRYIFYSLQALKEELLMQAEIGATRRALTKGMIEAMEVPLPPLPEQKTIASVLSSLDDKIDLLHRQNKTLEAMAETLFRQWFVEEAKEDWDEVTLSDCCQVITKGTTPTTLKKAFVPSGINFIKVNCIDKNGNFLADKFQFIDEETNELLGRSKLEEGDILYSIAGTIGRLIIVSREILPANVNQALAIIRVNSIKIYPVFIKYCLKDREITENLHSKVVHAVQPNLSLGEISKTMVPYPPKELLNDFIEIVEPIESKLLKNKTQINTIEKLRDTLLPKLMSGKVRVLVEGIKR